MTKKKSDKPENRYNLAQVMSIRRMLHDAFLRGFAYGKANEPNEKELLKKADEEVEKVIEYENEHNKDD